MKLGEVDQAASVKLLSDYVSSQHASAEERVLKRQQTMKVYVHLARGFEPGAWRRRWESGELVGTNDPTPYGYGRAQEMGCELRFSKDKPESLVGRYLRLGLRWFLGFDYLHAVCNAKAMFASDVVWTHTESQFLAIALVFKLAGRKTGRPKLIGQSVWLFDRWKHFSGLRRLFFRWLINDVDVLTVHSRENRNIATSLFPDKWVEMVQFGIPEDNKTEPRLRTADRIRVLCVGNDEHRDWATAIVAFQGRGDVDLRIISARADPKLATGTANVSIAPVGSNRELAEAFATATLMLVPLKRNHHASGITVMQEAAVHGLPIIATDTGGLRDYFAEDAVTYVPVGDTQAIARAVDFLVNNPDRAIAMARIAQSRMGEGGLGATAFVARHVELSRTMIEATG